MKELLNQFVGNVLNESTLLPILPKTPVHICFQIEYELFFLEISSQNCVIHLSSPGKTDVWIKGDHRHIEEIITGVERLRKLESRNLIRVTGKLKDILMAEALFYLGQKKLSA
ncbi:hypothetical protein [Bacillus pinisoli]|uniref:hypothetical protein n=1 Tax=Bacillus pinisoli TaxID=2901866 RepID=UPI001FF0FD81|nr:hypothetical protein [Bacillus pinisoli]